MLKLFRKKIVMKIILWGLVIIIVPAFVMWGGASTSSKNKGPNCVGYIDNRKVSFDELSNAIIGVRTQIILNYFNQPKALDALLTNKPILAKLGWDRILMLEEVKKARIKISDKELIETIRSHPLFARNGAFDDKFYTYMLRNNIGLEPRAFEENVRDNISLQKLSASLTKDIKLSDEDVLTEYKKEFGKLKISYILLEPKNFTGDVKIDENAAKDFYEKRKAELIIKSNLKGAIPDRQATFEESKETLEKFLKETEARTMLKGKSDEIHAELVKRMNEQGETLQKSAAKLNLEAKETDYFSKSDTVEAIGDIPFIVESASLLKTRELSGPLEINKGYIIFEITDKKDADEEAFKKDKEEYAKKVRELRSNQIMEKWLKDLENKAKLAIKLEDADKDYR